jgi:aminoglycoside 6'-N-acetyltransferase I
MVSVTGPTIVPDKALQAVFQAVDGESSDAGPSPLGPGPRPSDALLTTYQFRLSKALQNEAPCLPGPADFCTTPPDSRKEALKRRVADALTAHNPRLQICPFPYDQIAQFERISKEEARRKYRHLELNGSEGGNGIQIILRDDEAVVSVPFWHEGQKAADAIRELWRYLEIIGREAGYLVYDPQMNRQIDLAEGCDQVLGHYNRAARRIHEALTVGGTRAGEEGPLTRAVVSANCSEEQHLPEIRQIDPPEGAGVVVVAVRPNGSLCGFAEVTLRHEPVDGAPSGPIACLAGWYVAKDFRGRGIGRRLLESAEDWVAARHLKGLASHVESDNEAAIRTHLSCGFTQTGRAAHFFKLVPSSPSTTERP